MRNGAHERESAMKARANLELVRLRINAGLTPNDLALRASVSGNTVRAAERGLYVDVRSQYRIAQALGVLPLDVFPFERQRVAA
jgi:transcriptional regulator with XRE-family HTH domain